ncbi:hypothetical protein Q8F57_016690 [Paraburkholderia terrae]|uniref:hypothetical protein n=1 Tax=Paraburkholderia terrae TaxID=311230 RepID=UPI00296B4CFC|nr:hypothetical protein [Paraburkholderia terrae]MDW3663000.1 hypothetical protein [Paraburkholderia terrae]
MLICIGHSPVKPLAASPLMGSTAQSSKRSNVRRNFMAGIIAEVALETAYAARLYNRAMGVANFMALSESTLANIWQNIGLAPIAK